MVGVAAPTEEAAAEGGGEGHRGVSQVVIDEFTKHANAMRESSRARRDAVRLRSVVDDDHDAVAVDIRDTLGVPQPQDKWQGCTNLRTLRTLLSIVDDRGFERCASLLPLHSSHAKQARVLGQESPPNCISLGLRTVRVARGLQEGLGHLAPGHHAQERVEALLV